MSARQMFKAVRQPEDDTEWSDDPNTPQVPCFYHLRWDEIVDSSQKPVFKHHVAYTIDEVVNCGYCGVISIQNGIRAFRCANKRIVGLKNCKDHNK